MRSCLQKFALLTVICLAVAGCGPPFYIDPVDLQAFIDAQENEPTPRLVAIGLSGQAWWSPDGDPGNWIDSSPGGNNLRGIVFANDWFVAVGDAGQAWWSPDGGPGSWIDSSPGGNSLYGIAFGLLEN